MPLRRAYLRQTTARKDVGSCEYTIKNKHKEKKTLLPAKRPRMTWCGKCVAMKTREMQTLIWMIQKAIHRQDLKRRKLQRTEKHLAGKSFFHKGVSSNAKPTTPLQTLRSSDGRAGPGEVQSRGDHHIPHT